MNIAIRYYSRSGNTKKVAEAIGGAVNATALSIDNAVDEATDLLFIGGALYAGGIDKKLETFIHGLDSAKIKRAAVYSTVVGNVPACGKIKALLEKQHIPVVEETFSCKGKFLLAARDRPNETDLKGAAEFAKKVAGSF